MTEVVYVVAVVAVLVLGAWLWRRYGRWATIALAIALAAVVGWVELVLHRREAPKAGRDLPSRGEERLRRQLAEDLAKGQARLDEARKDGVAALKAELRRNQEDA